MEGNYLIRDHLLALSPELFQPPATHPITVPFATVPLNLYLRNCEALGRFPECPLLEEVAIRLRCGGQNSIDEAVRNLVDVFQSTWETGLKIHGATTVRRSQQVAYDNYDWKTHESGASWDRIVSPKYTVDTAELNGRKLSLVLGQPHALAAEIVRKMAASRAYVADSGVENLGEFLFVTPPRIQLKVDGFMLESFCWIEAAGRIKTGAKIATTKSEPVT